MLSYFFPCYLADPYIPPAVRLAILQGYPDGVVGPVIKLPAYPTTLADAIAMRTGSNLDDPVVNAIGHTLLGARFYLLVVHRVGPPEDPAALR